MTLPKVTLTELDGALGILPPSDGLFAILGVCSSGTANQPATYARARDVQSALGYGPLVEAACYYIERYGKPVCVVKTGQTTVGTYGSIATTVAGTSVVTVDAGTAPHDDYEAKILIVTGGTRGVAGITYKYSLDNGRTYSPVQALGTAIFITIPNSGGVKFDLAAGTLIAGDYWTIRCNAPNFNTADIQAGLDALRNSAVVWRDALIAGPVDGTIADAIEAKFLGMAVAGKDRNWIANTRIPNAAESEASYLSAMTTAFSAKAYTYGALTSGACRVVSSVSGRNYRRPVSFPVAAVEASVSEEINTADVNRGALPGVSIYDETGANIDHDEAINPGLDDARFLVLRSWGDDFRGAFVNLPRVFSQDGSDFRLIPHRRVMNLARTVLRPYLIRRLNKPIRVSKKTGFILEEEALEIEAGANAALRTALLTKPKASNAVFVLSRTDNILSTRQLNGEARITPLAYPETIVSTIGFENPALQVQTA